MQNSNSVLIRQLAPGVGQVDAADIRNIARPSFIKSYMYNKDVIVHLWSNDSF